MKPTPFTDALFNNIAKWAITAGFVIVLLQNTSPTPINSPGMPNVNEHAASVAEYDCRTMDDHICSTFDPVTGQWTDIEWFTI